MNITITGRAISKKNSKQIIRAGTRMLLIPSKQYKTFEKDALQQLVDQGLTDLVGKDEYMPVKMFTTPIKVDYIFHMKGKMDSDGDNMEAGINDILQKSGIIQNDSLIREWTGKKIPLCLQWKTEITITTLPDAEVLLKDENGTLNKSD